jgi:hypothetical protein
MNLQEIRQTRLIKLRILTHTSSYVRDPSEVKVEVDVNIEVEEETA